MTGWLSTANYCTRTPHAEIASGGLCFSIYRFSRRLTRCPSWISSRCPPRQPPMCVLELIARLQRAPQTLNSFELSVCVHTYVQLF
ncbi:hypothetical protein BM43_7616 (plasmid) [Burkholderia gladioli]|nr:hypothetical protein BM43_7616 [Burkholderia gladioli]